MIYVTKTFLPPQKEYQKILESAWDSQWVTNRGILVKELEGRMKEFLKVPFLTLTTNGTLPLQIAIKALQLSGEIITTPFSYVATTSSIVWENCQAIFVDIEPDYLTIDPNKIEEKITDQTSAILATHVYGNPCDVEAIEKIARKYNLKIIYDAAHCYGVKYKGKSIFNYGDVTTCSLHATKIMHTGEGGFWVTQSQDLQNTLFYHHNFGHDGPEQFHGLGINAKMSELQAALGHAVMNHWEEIYHGRKNAVAIYLEILEGSSVSPLSLRPNTEWNYHYMPVIFESEELLLSAQERMNAENIYPRRYFYPSLNNLPYVPTQSCPVSEDLSKRILCLPLWSDINEKQIQTIVDLLP